MAEAPTQRLDRVTSYGLVILAVLQGYALYFLQLAIEHHAWPATEPRWLGAFYTVAVGWPLFCYLGIARLRDWRNLWAGLPVALALFGLGWHFGWVNGGLGRGSAYGLLGVLPDYAISLGVALFILAFLFRAWVTAGGRPFAYGRLLALSWQNALTILLLDLFVAIFWLLLYLWAALFRVLGITFFSELFTKAIFAYPVTLLVVGCALVLIRNRIRLIATVQFLCEVLIKALLPLGALIVVAFLAALPFTGLHASSRTQDPGFLMTVLDLVMLFFFNAVLSENRDEPPYPKALRWFVFAAMVLLTANVAVSAWALAGRIGQYGLTVTRLWAVVVELLAAAYILPYAVILLWRRRAYAPALRATNVVLAFVVAAVLLVVNTPIADLHGISAHNQVARLLGGTVAPKDFDLRYLRFDAGRYGVEALHRLARSEVAARDPAFRARVEAALQQRHPWETPKPKPATAAVVRNSLVIVPGDASPPDSLLTYVASNDSAFGVCTLRGRAPCKLAALQDLTPGGAWALFVLTDERATVYGQTPAGAWRTIGRLESLLCASCSRARPLGPDDTLERMPGSYPAFTDGRHYFGFVPTLAFYREETAAKTPKP